MQYPDWGSSFEGLVWHHNLSSTLRYISLIPMISNLLEPNDLPPGNHCNFIPASNAFDGITISAHSYLRNSPDHKPRQLSKATPSRPMINDNIPFFMALHVSANLKHHISHCPRTPLATLIVDQITVGYFILNFDKLHLSKAIWKSCIILPPSNPRFLPE